jgi:ATP-dependent metalloprotease
VAANGEVLGTEKAPMYMQQLEPRWGAQAWRTVRTLGTAFIILSGLGALADDKGGISQRIMGGDGAVKPTPETSTKFEDVKGVDEAKSELVEIVGREGCVSL